MVFIRVKKLFINKIYGRRKWKILHNEVGRKSYGRMRKELKKATNKDKKEYLDSIWDEIAGCQRAGRCDIMYMKNKRLGAKENHGIQNIAIDNFKAQKVL
jgi:hypothetical protein